MRPISRRSLPTFLAGPFLVGLTCFAGCGQAATPPAPLTPVAKVSGVDISEPRLRLPPNGRDVTAGYLTLTNTSDKPQKLVAASSPNAQRVELHAHLKGPDGMAQMRQVKEVVIPARSTVVLAPGGLHLMVFGLSAPLKVGDQVPVELTFEPKQTVRFSLPVVTNPKSGAGDDAKAMGGHQH